jgi:hypothetical protein
VYVSDLYLPNPNGLRVWRSGLIHGGSLKQLVDYSSHAFASSRPTRQSRAYRWISDILIVDPHDLAFYGVSLDALGECQKAAD